MKVGVAGLGKMGSNIAARLIELGHETSVWNRTPDRATPLVEAGAHAAATPADLAQRCDVVLSIVTDGAAVDALFKGPAGFLSSEIAGKTFIEMSTIPPSVTKGLLPDVTAKGAVLVECPVGGTIGPARQGKLAAFLGAEPEDFERIKPLLEQLTRRIIHCGPVGSGALFKFAVNLPLNLYWQACGEALSMMRPLGIDPDLIMDVFSDASAGPKALQVRGPMIAKMLKGEQPGPTTFDLDSALKDMRAMRAEAQARGLDMPLLNSAIGCYETASKAGIGAQDACGLSVFWSQNQPD